MKWAPAAEEKLSRVPFFVRKRVRKKVEEEAMRQRANEVRLEHVLAAQQRYLTTMEEEIRGFQVERCFGESGCPNRAVLDDGMAARIENLLREKDLRAFLKQRVAGPLKLHHEFRVSISDCPNGCSRPQIVDLGLIGARVPHVTEGPCTQCTTCVGSCKESAIEMRPGESSPRIDANQCVVCGQCIAACPEGAIQELKRGYRILVGGKLGRHPQLARDLGMVFTPEDALWMVDRCITHYMNHNRRGERFGDILNRTGLEPLLHREAEREGPPAL